MSGTVGFGDGLEADDLGIETESPPGGNQEPLETSADASEKSRSPKESTSEKAPAESEATAESKESAQEPSEGESAPEETGATGEPKDEKPLNVFGKEYPDINSAFHALKSQYGQMRAWQERYQDLESKYDELQENLNARSQESSRPTEQPPPPSTAEAAQAKPAEGSKRKFTETIDWDFVDRLAQDPEYGPGKAVQFALQEIDGYVEDRLAEKLTEREQALEERFKPSEELVQMQQEAAEAQKAFEAIASRTNDDGSPTFPEFASEDENDAEFVRRVLTRWKDTPALKGQGEYGAYLAYLDEQRWNQYLASTLPDAEKPSDGAEKKLEAENDRLASSVTANGGSTPLPGDKAKQSFASRFKRSLYEEGDDTKDAALLGF